MQSKEEKEKLNSSKQEQNENIIDLEKELCNQLRKLNLMDVQFANEILRKKLIFKNQEEWDAFTELVISFIKRTQNFNLQDNLIRIIGDSYCTKAIDFLIDLFKECNDNSIRWVIGNSLSLIKIPTEKLEAISKLISNKEYGKGRQMLLYVLAKNKKFDSIDIIYKAIEDPDLIAHAIHALGRIGTDSKNIDKIRPYLKHERTLVRTTAKTAIERINKRIAKKKKL